MKQAVHHSNQEGEAAKEEEEQVLLSYDLSLL